MNYKTLFEYTPGISKVYFLLPLVLVIFTSIIIIIYIKRTKKISLLRQVTLFFFYFFTGFSLLAFILITFHLPNIIKQEKTLKEMIKTQHYSVVEGSVQNYKLTKVNGRYYESFEIKDIHFEYSDFNKVDGFYQTALNGGPIKKNGQILRISYYTSGKEHLILKIEERDTIQSKTIDF